MAANVNIGIIDTGIIDTEIINAQPSVASARTRVRESFAPVPNTIEAAEALAAAEAAISARIFDTSRLPIYVPTGHGELVVRDGDFVKHRVPDGCMYITFGYAGVATWNSMFEKFLESFKDPEVMECFQNPTIPENQIKLKKFFEPHMFDEKGKFTIKEDGILSIKFPKEEYIEARYFLTADFADSEIITDSGFYNAKTLAKKDIKKIEILEEHPDSVTHNFRHILECYNGSIIPGPRFIYDRLNKRFSNQKKNPFQHPTIYLRDTTMGWPFLEQYDDFFSFEEWEAEFLQKIKDSASGKHKSSSSTIVDFFIKLLRAIREELRGLPENIYKLTPKAQGKVIKPINELVIKGLNILRKAKTEAERAGVKHYPFVYSTLGLFEHLKETKYDTSNVSKLVIDIQRHIIAIESKRGNSEQQFPGEGPLQSFLFKNFPGIHINFLCRVPSDEKGISPSTILKAQHLSNRNRAEKQNLKLARELAEPTAFIGSEKKEMLQADAKERRMEMARLVELNRQAKLISDPFALRNLHIYPPKRNISEAELEEMREFVRRHEKQLSNAPITPRSTGKLSLPSSWGSLSSNRSTRKQSGRKQSGRKQSGQMQSSRASATRRQRNRI